MIRVNCQNERNHWYADQVLSRNNRPRTNTTFDMKLTYHKDNVGKNVLCGKRQRAQRDIFGHGIAKGTLIQMSQWTYLRNWRMWLKKRRRKVNATKNVVKKAAEESKCNECHALIGGTRHNLRTDNSLAGEMDGDNKNTT